MSTRNKLEPDFLRVLNEALSDNPFWRNLMEKTTKVINDVVHEQTTQLARARDPQIVHRGDYVTTELGRGRVVHVDRKPATVDEVHVYVRDVGNVVIPLRSVHQRGVLIDGARFMGFDYFSDSLTDEDYARVYRYIGEYWNDSAGTKFVDFLGFIKNTRFEIAQLWTEDKGDFATSDEVPISNYDWLEPNIGYFEPVYGSYQDYHDAQTATKNKAYPTSHVELNYDLNYTDSKLSDEDVEDVICLFYYMAPIHLVLQRINASVNVDFETIHGLSPQMHMYDASEYHWSADLDITTHGGYGFQLHSYDATALVLTGALDPWLNRLHHPEEPAVFSTEGLIVGGTQLTVDGAALIAAVPPGDQDIISIDGEPYGLVTDLLNNGLTDDNGDPLYHSLL